MGTCGQLGLISNNAFGLSALAGRGFVFGPKNNITVKIKLFSGLDRQAGVDDYDPDRGIDLDVSKDARLKKAARLVGLYDYDSIAFFINGKRAGPREKLNDGDVVFFMRPVFGG